MVQGIFEPHTKRNREKRHKENSEILKKTDTQCKTVLYLPRLLSGALISLYQYVHPITGNHGSHGQRLTLANQTLCKELFTCILDNFHDYFRTSNCLIQPRKTASVNRDYYTGRIVSLKSEVISSETVVSLTRLDISN